MAVRKQIDTYQSLNKSEKVRTFAAILTTFEGKRVIGTMVFYAPSAAMAQVAAENWWEMERKRGE
jgi:hypothetical protein